MDVPEGNRRAHFPGERGWAMTATFLRCEAAHYRELANTAKREQLKLRLLTLAKDYDALARAVEQNRDDAALVAPDDFACADSVDLGCVQFELV